MNRFEGVTKPLMWSMVLLLSALAAGCGGDAGRHSILGAGGIAPLTPPDTTKPRVTITFPATTIPGPTPAVPTNTAITAVFTEDMAPATITALNTFTLTGPGVTPVAGTASYAGGSRTAVFTPNAALAGTTTYTATITTAATDLAGNSLAGNQAPLPAASNYVWTFTTAAGAATGTVSVASTIPVNFATGVCPNATVSATFLVTSNLQMNPLTVNATTFTVTGSGAAPGPVVASSIALDAATGLTATFTPSAPLTAGVLYTATIKSGPTGVTDLAIPANAMTGDKVWSFTAGPATGPCFVLTPPPLGKAQTFGTFGGSAGMTNSGILTVVNGDIGTIATGTSAITGFHDKNGDIYTETPLNIGAVNGLIYTCTVSTTGPTSAAVNPTNCTFATQARLDAQAAYLYLAGLAPGGASPAPGAALAGKTLFPGVYTDAGGGFLLQGGVGADLTLDGQGNANAVWVFQTASTLTVGASGAPRSVLLTNGAQAKNVFWQVGSQATINPGGGGTMVGTIIAQQGVVFSTAGSTTITTLNGRAQSLVASVTMVNTVINVPAP